MTNGEKLEQIFPDGICPFSQNWLKTEYKEPTTKNDLEVDCISRQAVLDLINADWKYENLEIEINNLPSVTPIRPKGHWIWCGGSHKCSNCEEYTCFSHKVRYCPNCGSDNREVE